MIDDFLQDRSAPYVSGAMTEPERDEFELVLEFHDEVRQFVFDLQEVAAAISFARVPSDAPQPSAELKSKILRAVADQPRPVTPAGLVVTDPDRLVQWVNPAFTAMCGYSLNELRARNLARFCREKRPTRGRFRECAAQSTTFVHAGKRW